MFVLRRSFILLSLIFLLGVGGCASRRLSLLSLQRYSDAELVDLYRGTSARWSGYETMKAWFKVRISGPGGKDGFKAALYFKEPDKLRLDRWGFMNQLTGTVFGNGDSVVVEIPSQGRYLLGNARELAAALWGEAFLLSDMPGLLLGRPPLADTVTPRISRRGRFILIESGKRRMLLGLERQSRDISYLAELDDDGHKLWEVFYYEPQQVGDLRLMSRLKIRVGRTTIELNLRKVMLDRELADDLFEVNIAPRAQVEQLREVVRW